jgi:hypothetical protein
LCRKGYRYNGNRQDRYYRHYAKNRDFTAHTNLTSMRGWARSMCLGSTIAGEGPLPIPWLTLT